MTGIAVLGSTGSVGASTLDVLARHPDRYHVHRARRALGHRRLLAQCIAHRPRLADPRGHSGRAASSAPRCAAAGFATRVESGRTALVDAVRDAEVEVVMAAIVGAAGLPSTLAAARAGKRVLLANKESLVVGGALLVSRGRARRARR